MATIILWIVIIGLSALILYQLWTDFQFRMRDTVTVRARIVRHHVNRGSDDEFDSYIPILAFTDGGKTIEVQGPALAAPPAEGTEVTLVYPEDRPKLAAPPGVRGNGWLLYVVAGVMLALAVAAVRSGWGEAFG